MPPVATSFFTPNVVTDGNFLVAIEPPPEVNAPPASREDEHPPRYSGGRDPQALHEFEHSDDFGAFVQDMRTSVNQCMALFKRRGLSAFAGEGSVLHRIAAMVQGLEKGNDNFPLPVRRSDFYTHAPLLLERLQAHLEDEGGFHMQTQWHEALHGMLGHCDAAGVLSELTKAVERLDLTGRSGIAKLAAQARARLAALTPPRGFEMTNGGGIFRLFARLNSLSVGHTLPLWPGILTEVIRVTLDIKKAIDKGREELKRKDLLGRDDASKEQRLRYVRDSSAPDVSDDILLTKTSEGKYAVLRHCTPPDWHLVRAICREMVSAKLMPATPLMLFEVPGHSDGVTVEIHQKYGCMWVREGGIKRPPMPADLQHWREVLQRELAKSEPAEDVVRNLTRAIMGYFADQDGAAQTLREELATLSNHPRPFTNEQHQALNAVQEVAEHWVSDHDTALPTLKRTITELHQHTFVPPTEARVLLPLPSAASSCAPTPQVPKPDLLHLRAALQRELAKSEPAEDVVRNLTWAIIGFFTSQNGAAKALLEALTTLSTQTQPFTNEQHNALSALQEVAEHWVNDKDTALSVLKRSVAGLLQRKFVQPIQARFLPPPPAAASSSAPVPQVPKPALGAADEPIIYSHDKYGSLEEFKNHPDFPRFQMQYKALIKEAVQFAEDHAQKLVPTPGTPADAGPGERINAQRLIKVQANFDSFQKHLAPSSTYYGTYKASVWGSSKETFTTACTLLRDESIPLHKRLSAVQNLAEKCNDVCAGGLATELQNFVFELKPPTDGLRGEAQRMKFRLAQQLVTEFMKANCSYGNSVEVHVVNSALNYIHADWGFALRQDDYAAARINRDSEDMLARCRTHVNNALTPALLVKAMAEEYHSLMREAVIDELQKGGVAKPDLHNPIPNHLIGRVNDRLQDTAKALVERYGELPTSTLLLSQDSETYYLAQRPTLVVASMSHSLQEQSVISAAPLPLAAKKAIELRELGGALWLEEESQPHPIEISYLKTLSPQGITPTTKAPAVLAEALNGASATMVMSLSDEWLRHLSFDQLLPHLRNLNADDGNALLSRAVWLGLNIEQVDAEGGTPLLKACAFNAPETARWLIDHGANLKACDRKGRNAIYLCLENGAAGLLQSLLDVARGNPGLQKELFEHKKNVAFALDTAVDNDHGECIKIYFAFMRELPGGANLYVGWIREATLSMRPEDFKDVLEMSPAAATYYDEILKWEALSEFHRIALIGELPKSRLYEYLRSQSNHAAPFITKYVEAVLDSPLSNSAKMNILRARASFGRSGLYQAARSGLHENSTAYLNAVLRSQSISPENKVQLVNPMLLLFRAARVRPEFAAVAQGVITDCVQGGFISTDLAAPLLNAIHLGHMAGRVTNFFSVR